MLMTAKDYVESLRKLKLNLYLFGEKVDNWVDNPIIRPSLNAVAMTYKLAHEPKTRDLATTKSMLTGDIVNRFNSLFKSTDDLVDKVILWTEPMYYDSCPDPFITANGNVYEFRCLEDGLHVIRWTKE